MGDKEMKYEQIRKVINGVIENEFKNVNEFKEPYFSDIDKEYIRLDENSSKLMEELIDTLSEEQQNMFNNFESAFIEQWKNILRFYFKEGVRAGLTNLKFLDEIDHIGTYM